MNEEKEIIEGIIKKPYSKPRIIHETRLEVRAGSPLGGFNPLSTITPDYMRDE
jgi:hypothetical protein